MIRFLSLLSVTVFISCMGAPVKLHDNAVEPVFEKVLRESAIHKRLENIDFSAKTFTIEDLFLLSIDRTEQLAIAAERGVAADAKYYKSFGAWLPKISILSARYAPFSPTFAIPGVRFTARQNIMTGLNEYTGIVGARLERVAEEQNLRAEMAAHLMNIADAALQYQLSIAVTHEAREAVRITQASLAEIRRRVSLGRNKRGDSLKTEARLRQKQADLLAAEEQEAQWKRRIAFLTGYNDEFVFVPETQAFAADDFDAKTGSLDARSDIALGKALVALRRNDVKAAFGGHLPNIYLDGSYRPSLDGSQPSSYFGSLTAELPLFAGGQVIQNQNIAASQLRQAELQLSLAERKARTELLDAHDSLVKASAEKKAYAESAEAAEKNYNAQRNDLRLSMATILDVIQSMEDLQNARLARAHAEYRESIARVRFFVATGRMFPARK